VLEQVLNRVKLPPQWFKIVESRDAVTSCVLDSDGTDLDTLTGMMPLSRCAAFSRTFVIVSSPSDVRSLVLFSTRLRIHDLTTASHGLASTCSGRRNGNLGTIIHQKLEMRHAGRSNLVLPRPS
jgi:hypothetical protein